MSSVKKMLHTSQYHYAFYRDNWLLGRIGDQSFDNKAGSLQNMFDFVSKAGHVKKLLIQSSMMLHRMRSRSIQ